MFQKSRKSTTFIMVILLILAMSMTTFTTVYAMDFQGKGSLNITLRGSGSHTVLSGAAFTIYRVADVVNDDDNLTYIYTEEFKGNGMELDNLNSDGLAQHLTAHARVEDLEGITETSLDNGSVVFDPLDVGLYLIVQKGSVEGYYSTTPFLVSIPMANSQDASWIYHVKANPKMEEGPNKDPKPTPDGSISFDPGTPPSGPMDEVPPSLIQTGQLNWPIPILAAIGLMLFALGWALTFLKKKKSYEE